MKFTAYLRLEQRLRMSGDMLLPPPPISLHSVDRARFILIAKLIISCDYEENWGRSQWQRGLRSGSAAARLLRVRVRIPPEAWMFVCCECCVLLGRGHCVGLITRLEESYRLWCV